MACALQKAKILSPQGPNIYAIVVPDRAVKMGAQVRDPKNEAQMQRNMTAPNIRGMEQLTLRGRIQ